MLNGRIEMKTLKLVVALVLSVALVACGDEEPVGPSADKGPGGKDLLWPDYGRQDYLPTKKDARPKKDAGPSDAGVDGQEPDIGDCELVEATCSSTCDKDEFCTEAGGGTCTPLATLAGDPRKKEVALAFLLAVVETWKQGPSENTLCATLDTCGMDGDLTAEMIEDWMCKEAQILDFPTSEDYEAGRDICGCGTYMNDMDWQISAISPGERGRICLIYEVSFYDEIFVDECKNYPY